MKPAGGVHSLGGDEERVIAGGRFCQSDPHAFEYSKDFMNLLLAEAIAPELGQNTVMSDNASLRFLAGIIRAESNELISRPAQEYACAYRVRIFKRVTIKLSPFALFRHPVRRI